MRERGTEKGNHSCRRCVRIEGNYFLSSSLARVIPTLSSAFLHLPCRQTALDELLLIYFRNCHGNKSHGVWYWSRSTVSIKSLFMKDKMSQIIQINLSDLLWFLCFDITTSCLTSLILQAEDVFVIATCIWSCFYTESFLSFVLTVHVFSHWYPYLQKRSELKTTYGGFGKRQSKPYSQVLRHWFHRFVEKGIPSSLRFWIYGMKHGCGRGCRTVVWDKNKIESPKKKDSICLCGNLVSSVFHLPIS